MDDSQVKGTKSLLEYFELGDGIDVSWAHAVNSKKLLSTSIEDETNILEADVVMDPIKNKPIMSHPPKFISDLDLETFLTTTLAKVGKGIKLDFKQTQVLSPSIDMLKQLASSIDELPPILLNADILIGPNNPTSLPVDSEAFLNSCKQFPQAILSPGWTTNFNISTGEISGYSWEMVKEMASLMSGITNAVTFPIRASLVGLSKDQLLWLLNQDEERYSLTIWKSDKDKWNIKDLKFLRQLPKRVFYDLSDKQISDLKGM